MRAYLPPRATSSSWVPVSTIAPWSSTTICPRHAHGREAVRDDDRRAALGELAEALEDGVLGLGVERGGRLVEHEDVGLLAHEGARQRDLLPLPAGELGAVLEPAPERRVEAARERRHELGRAPARRRALDPRRVVEVLDAPEADVLAHLELVLVEVLEDDAEARGEARPAASSRRSRPSRRMRPSVGS